VGAFLQHCNAEGQATFLLKSTDVLIEDENQSYCTLRVSEMGRVMPDDVAFTVIVYVPRGVECGVGEGEPPPPPQLVNEKQISKIMKGNPERPLRGRPVSSNKPNARAGNANPEAFPRKFAAVAVVPVVVTVTVKGTAEAPTAIGTVEEGEQLESGTESVQAIVTDPEKPFCPLTSR
jgi:hypothetical protein